MYSQSIYKKKVHNHSLNFFSQIGKTGAWLLMIRLLHDHLRSSQGVMVENLPVSPSMFLPSSLRKPSPPTTSSTTSTSSENSSTGEEKSPSSAHSRDRHFGHFSSSPRAALAQSGGASHVTGSLSSSSLKHSRIVPLEHLRDLCLAREDSKNAIKLSPTTTIATPAVVAASPRDTSVQSSAESTAGLPVGSNFDARHLISVSVSPYMSYDFTHSCNDCSKYVRGTSLTVPDFLTFALPCAPGRGVVGGESCISVKWYVPSVQQKHCVINNNHKTLERLKLPMMKVRGDKNPLLYPMTPVFTPTLGRDSSGLFNLFHNQYHHIHVLVTSESEFGKYCKAWPNHLIMALPDKEATGLGKEAAVCILSSLFCLWSFLVGIIIVQAPLVGENPPTPTPQESFV